MRRASPLASFGPTSLRSRVRRWAVAAARPLVCKWFTPSTLLQGLESLGVTRERPLLVHASLSAMGYVPGGAEAVIAALRRYTRRATLIMPAHTWEWIHRGLVQFDPWHTPGCVGRIAETFRLAPDVCRSVHPTHSVAAAGLDAERLVAGHLEAATPCGAGTPYAALAQCAGEVLLLGVGLECNTLFHTAEALADVPYLLEDKPRQIEVADAPGAPMALRLFRLHRVGLRRRFAELAPWLMETGIYRALRVKHVPLGVLDAHRFCDELTTLLRSRPLLLLAPRDREVWAGPGTA